MRRAARRDINEPEIVAALQAAGCSVLPANNIDLIVGRAGANFLLEVKTPQSRDHLKPSQVRLLREWRGQYSIVTTPEEALKAVGAA